MGYVQGEGRTQATLFPVTLEELIPDDHVCRVIDPKTKKRCSGTRNIALVSLPPSFRNSLQRREFVSGGNKGFRKGS